MSQTVPLPEGAQAIIFDLDGTLVDSMPLHLRAYQYAIEPWGVTYSAEVFQSRAGMPTIQTFELIEKDYGLKNFSVQEACDRKRDFFGKNLDQLQLIDPVAEIMRSQQNKMPMSIGTGSYRKTVEKVVNLFGLLDYISHVVTADDVQQHKPHPETFLACAERMEMAPAHCVVYEDGDPGVQAALAAGMQVVDVREYL
ncbi:MAG TPA: phosphatase [Cytophagales bacterium]|nr:phosphatase [Cytophagales bacterium]HAA20508.1 phosphatase [Cytophagales bacterium]HAP59064.1 phosphatase [Cytophagales bacterium]